MNSLPIRFFSAAIALIIFFGTVSFFKVKGLLFFCLVASILSARELNRMLLSKFNKSTQLTFRLFSLLTFIVCANPVLHTLTALPLIIIIFFMCSLLLHQYFVDLKDLLIYLAYSFFGLFYAGLLPALAARILYQKDGATWFMIMLAVVFVGDTCAYLTGVAIGKNKLAPRISPKKTVEGGIGGLIGSAITGAICCNLWLPQVSTIQILILSIFAGLAAQMGDFFESMIKRIADVKDSGTIMPGHGGVLDRIDGVLFAIPVFYFGAYFISENIPLSSILGF